MKKLVKYTAILFAATLLLGLTGLVIDTKAGPDCGSCAVGCAESETATVTITGFNFCPGCKLKKEFGAASNCKEFGCTNALRITKIKADDDCAVDDYVGTTIFYLENEKSTKLVSELKGKAVEVKGKLYLSMPVLEVDSYKVVEG